MTQLQANFGDVPESFFTFNEPIIAQPGQDPTGQNIGGGVVQTTYASENEQDVLKQFRQEEAELRIQADPEFYAKLQEIYFSRNGLIGATVERFFATGGNNNKKGSGFAFLLEEADFFKQQGIFGDLINDVETDDSVDDLEEKARLAAQNKMIEAARVNSSAIGNFAREAPSFLIQPENFLGLGLLSRAGKLSSLVPRIPVVGSNRALSTFTSNTLKASLIAGTENAIIEGGIELIGTDDRELAVNIPAGFIFGAVLGGGLTALSEVGSFVTRGLANRAQVIERNAVEKSLKDGITGTDARRHGDETAEILTSSEQLDNAVAYDQAKAVQINAELGKTTAPRYGPLKEDGSNAFEAAAADPHVRSAFIDAEVRREVRFLKKKNYIDASTFKALVKGANEGNVLEVRQILDTRIAGATDERALKRLRSIREMLGAGSEDLGTRTRSIGESRTGIVEEIDDALSREIDEAMGLVENSELSSRLGERREGAKRSAIEHELSETRSIDDSPYWDRAYQSGQYSPFELESMRAIDDVNEREILRRTFDAMPQSVRTLFESVDVRRGETLPAGRDARIVMQRIRSAIDRRNQFIAERGVIDLADNANVETMLEEMTHFVINTVFDTKAIDEMVTVFSGEVRQHRAALKAYIENPSTKRFNRLPASLQALVKNIDQTNLQRLDNLDANRPLDGMDQESIALLAEEAVARETARRIASGDALTRNNKSIYRKVLDFIRYIFRRDRFGMEQVIQKTVTRMQKPSKRANLVARELLTRKALRRNVVERFQRQLDEFRDATNRRDMEGVEKARQRMSDMQKDIEEAYPWLEGQLIVMDLVRPIDDLANRDLLSIVDELERWVSTVDDAQTISLLKSYERFATPEVQTVLEREFNPGHRTTAYYSNREAMTAKANEFKTQEQSVANAVDTFGKWSSANGVLQNLILGSRETRKILTTFTNDTPLTTLLRTKGSLITDRMSVGLRSLMDAPGAFISDIQGKPLSTASAEQIKERIKTNAIGSGTKFDDAFRKWDAFDEQTGNISPESARSRGNRLLFGTKPSGPEVTSRRINFFQEEVRPHLEDGTRAVLDAEGIPANQLEIEQRRVDIINEGIDSIYEFFESSRQEFIRSGTLDPAEFRSRDSEFFNADTGRWRYFPRKWATQRLRADAELRQQLVEQLSEDIFGVREGEIAEALVRHINEDIEGVFRFDVQGTEKHLRVPRQLREELNAARDIDDQEAIEAITNDIVGDMLGQANDVAIEQAERWVNNLIAHRGIKDDIYDIGQMRIKVGSREFRIDDAKNYIDFFENDPIKVMQGYASRTGGTHAINRVLSDVEGVTFDRYRSRLNSSLDEFIQNKADKAGNKTAKAAREGAEREGLAEELLEQTVEEARQVARDEVLNRGLTASEQKKAVLGSARETILKGEETEKYRAWTDEIVQRKQQEIAENRIAERDFNAAQRRGEIPADEVFQYNRLLDDMEDAVFSWATKDGNDLSKYRIGPREIGSEYVRKVVKREVRSRQKLRAEETLTKQDEFAKLTEEEKVARIEQSIVEDEKLQLAEKQTLETVQAVMEDISGSRVVQKLDEPTAEAAIQTLENMATAVYLWKTVVLSFAEIGNKLMMNKATSLPIRTWFVSAQKRMRSLPRWQQEFIMGIADKSDQILSRGLQMDATGNGIEAIELLRNSTDKGLKGFIKRTVGFGRDASSDLTRFTMRAQGLEALDMRRRMAIVIDQSAAFADIADKATKGAKKRGTTLEARPVDDAELSGRLRDFGGLRAEDRGDLLQSGFNSKDLEEILDWTENVSEYLGVKSKKVKMVNTQQMDIDARQLYSQADELRLNMLEDIELERIAKDSDEADIIRQQVDALESKADRIVELRNKYDSYMRSKVNQIVVIPNDSTRPTSFRDNRTVKALSMFLGQPLAFDAKVAAPLAQREAGMVMKMLASSMSLVIMGKLATDFISGAADKEGYAEQFETPQGIGRWMTVAMGGSNFMGLFGNIVPETIFFGAEFDDIFDAASLSILGDLYEVAKGLAVDTPTSLVTGDAGDIVETLRQQAKSILEVTPGLNSIFLKGMFNKIDRALFEDDLGVPFRGVE